MSNTGICFFAYNNNQLDYVQFAHIAAAYVKQNMKNNTTCLVTDTGTYSWLKESVPRKLHSACFDEVVISDDEMEPNPRRHFDSPWTEFNAQFSNSNKHKIIDYSPFDKTLLVDTDFIVQNNFYDYIFETDIPVSLHRTAKYLENQSPYTNEQRLSDNGIQHWWSTVVYFDKSDESRTFFDMWAHVKDNWDYYALLYKFPSKLYRTDFCVSIVSHVLNGFNENGFVHDFMNEPLRNMDQKDDIVEVKSPNDWVLLSHNRKEPWKNILERNVNSNIHVMNKRSLSRQASNIMDMIQKEGFGV